MSNKKYISFYYKIAHDPSISVYSESENKFLCIELERLLNIRYLEDSIPEFYDDFILNYVKNILQENGFDENFDVACFVRTDNITDDDLININIYKKYFNIKEVRFFNHHESHAASSFYSSNFNESLIISYDGMGNDGNFAVFEADLINGIKKINKFSTTPLTLFYSYIGNYIDDIGIKNYNKSSLNVTIAGKLMGISAYGGYNKKMYDIFYQYFVTNTDKANSNFDFAGIEKFLFEGLSSILGEKNKKIYTYQEQYDLAYNIQLAFENFFIDLFKQYFNPHKHKNVCLSGGGALNVLLNEKLSKMYPDVNFHVPPNPNDCGLSFGALSLGVKRKIKDEIMYCGLPILDEEILPNILMYRGAEEATPQLIAKEIYSGKIIGICRNQSEIGPRALGNRSILANPTMFNIKDDLNKKVKFREWFRPFAPICVEENASEYFEISKNVSYKYMSYSPKVKEQYRRYLPSITHIDGSSRLQTLNRNQNEYIYDILKEFEKLSGYPILVNTSFNVRGNPILTHYQAALQNLDSTQLDGIVLDKYYIKKTK